MGQGLSLGSLICLLCMLTTLFLDGGSSELIGNGNKENKAVTMAEAENGKYAEVEVEGKNRKMKVEVEINGEDGEKMDRGRELIFNIDYHGPTTHPPATPVSPKRSPGPHRH